MPAKTPEENRARVAASKKRRYEAGKIQIKVWAYPEHKDAIVRHAKRLETIGDNSPEVEKKASEGETEA